MKGTQKVCLAIFSKQKVYKAMYYFFRDKKFTKPCDFVQAQSSESLWFILAKSLQALMIFFERKVYEAFDIFLKRKVHMIFYSSEKFTRLVIFFKRKFHKPYDFLFKGKVHKAIIALRFFFERKNLQGYI